MQENEYFLNLNVLPQYIYGAPRKFYEGEHHVTRTTPDSVLILMFEGTLRFEEAGKEIDVKKGEYYIQRGNIYQTGNRPSSSPEYFFIHFNGDYFSSADVSKQPELSSRALPIRGTFEEYKIKSLTERLFYLGYNAAATEYASAFYTILTELASPRRLSAAEKIRRKLIEATDKQLSLTKLAKEFYCSKNNLIETFKKEFHKTPYAYYTEYRLLRAKQLIETTELSLTQIAESAGYPDYLLFYKAFKKHFSISPSKLRKSGESLAAPDLSTN